MGVDRQLLSSAVLATMLFPSSFPMFSASICKAVDSFVIMINFLRIRTIINLVFGNFHVFRSVVREAAIGTFAGLLHRRFRCGVRLLRIFLRSSQYLGLIIWDWRFEIGLDNFVLDGCSGEYFFLSHHLPLSSLLDEVSGLTECKGEGGFKVLD